MDMSSHPMQWNNQQGRGNNTANLEIIFAE